MYQKSTFDSRYRSGRTSRTGRTGRTKKPTKATRASGWVKTSRARGIVAFEKPMIVTESQIKPTMVSGTQPFVVQIAPSQNRKRLLDIIGEKRKLGSE